MVNSEIALELYILDLCGVDYIPCETCDLPAEVGGWCTRCWLDNARASDDLVSMPEPEPDSSMEVITVNAPALRWDILRTLRGQGSRNQGTSLKTDALIDILYATPESILMTCGFLADAGLITDVGLTEPKWRITEAGIKMLDFHDGNNSDLDDDDSDDNDNGGGDPKPPSSAPVPPSSAPAAAINPTAYLLPAVTTTTEKKLAQMAGVVIGSGEVIELAPLWIELTPDQNAALWFAYGSNAGGIQPKQQTDQHKALELELAALGLAYLTERNIYRLTPYGLQAYVRLFRTPAAYEHARMTINGWYRKNAWDKRPNPDSLSPFTVTHRAKNTFSRRSHIASISYPEAS